MPHRPDDGDDSPDRATGSRGEIYLEFKQLGQAMKVTAVDAATGAEVVIMGPVSASQNDLKKVAIRKLEMKLKKTAEDTEPDDDDTSGSKGWIA